MRHQVGIVLFVLSFGTYAAAQSAPQTRGYDPAAEQSIAGTVKAVATFRDAADTVSVHLDLRTADGLVSVHVAPAMFMGQSNVAFSFGDEVEIIGARTEQDGNVAVWAKAIRKGRMLVEFRNADGTPKWTPSIDGTDGCGVNHESLPRGTER